ncbi:MAG: hypothetical protein P4L79_06230 [Legionella sp.]|uniref:hypothetical protein n=1 Tax=Legionella sp. TaxID=459 RepID=UPI00283BAA90|nr:hypothetical protein [Legionella sp.]
MKYRDEGEGVKYGINEDEYILYETNDDYDHLFTITGITKVVYNCDNHICYELKKHIDKKEFSAGCSKLHINKINNIKDESDFFSNLK